MIDELLYLINTRLLGNYVPEPISNLFGAIFTILAVCFVFACVLAVPLFFIRLLRRR